MKAVVISNHGGAEALVVEERAEPSIAPHEVRLRVLAVSLNHLDLWVRRGVPGHRFPLPIIPGCDMAGEVLEVGASVKTWKPGDRALVAPGLGCGACRECLSGDDHLCRYYGIFGETRDGGCAEQVAVPATHLLRPPANLALVEAASLPLALLTAWHMVAVRAQVRPGEQVLVQAGGSGVGVMAIQIARLFAATVLTTVGDARKAELARSLGADAVILHREVDFAEEARRLTGKRGVDVIVDHIGTDTFARDIRCLAKGGRLVICGATAGAEVAIDLRHVFFKGLSVLGSTMGSRGELDTALPFVTAGRIRPVVDRVFAMEELPAAHEWLESRRAFGKVVVRGFGVSPAEVGEVNSRFV